MMPNFAMPHERPRDLEKIPTRNCNVNNAARPYLAFILDFLENFLVTHPKDFGKA